MVRLSDGILRFLALSVEICNHTYCANKRLSSRPALLHSKLLVFLGMPMNKFKVRRILLVENVLTPNRRNCGFGT